MPKTPNDKRTPQELHTEELKRKKAIKGQKVIGYTMTKGQHTSDLVTIFVQGACIITSQKMQVKGLTKHHPVIVLADSLHIDNFIHVEFAE